MRSRRDEFCEAYDGDLEIASLNQALLDWESVYNRIRPRQALGYLTLHRFVPRQQTQRKEAMCH